MPPSRVHRQNREAGVPGVGELGGTAPGEQMVMPLKRDQPRASGAPGAAPGKTFDAAARVLPQ
ncbi:MAG: hypothetical protein ACYDB8_06255 [Acidiferrobacterales bacterium]